MSTLLTHLLTYLLYFLSYLLILLTLLTPLLTYLLSFFTYFNLPSPGIFTDSLNFADTAYFADSTKTKCVLNNSILR